MPHRLTAGISIIVLASYLYFLHHHHPHIPNAATCHCHANLLVHTDVSTHVLGLSHRPHHWLAIKVLCNLEKERNRNRGKFDKTMEDGYARFPKNKIALNQV